MAKILILDGAQRSALAATRALGRSGHEVIVADSEDSMLAGASKHSTGHFSYPDPNTSAAAAIEKIVAYTTDYGVDLMMPMTDVSSHLMLSAKINHKLPQMPCAPLSLYEHASDKGRLAKTAIRFGVSIPDTELIDSGRPLDRLPNGFSFPVVLKPTRSRVTIRDGYANTVVMIARDLEQFIAIQRDNNWFQETPWLLQSFVEGKGQGVFSIYDQGRPVAWFAHERIREKPPTGGVSVLSRSAPLSPKLKHAAKTLLDALEWHGPAMVEFRVTEDGTPYLMEINARFWGSLQLAVSSGVNFPLLAAQIAMGEHPEPVEDYKLGVYNRWLLGDLDNLYLTLKAPRRDFSLGQKIAAIGQFMIPWWPGLRYEVNQWGDMRPFWHELKHYLR